MTQRIQLRRTKGWRKPIGQHARDRVHAVDLFSRWLLDSQDRCTNVWRELRCRDLACWCPPDQPCHADVLLYGIRRNDLRVCGPFVR